MTTGVERLTDDTYEPSSTVPLKDDEGKYTGVSVTHSSSNACKVDADGNATNYSFNTIVMCDKEITA